MFFFASIKEQWKHTNETSYNNSQSSSLQDTRAHKKSPLMPAKLSHSLPQQQRSMNDNDNYDLESRH